MARRRQAEKRDILPDTKFRSVNVARFTHKVMQRGKVSVANGIVYDAFDIIEKETKKPPIDTFELALRNATPMLEVKPRRVGGATYQVPIEIRGDRRWALGMRWLINAAQSRKGRPMAERLAAELLDAAKGQGAAVKRKEDLHKMAEANRAFVHYRW